jgi:O-antigen biosynthesis protein
MRTNSGTRERVNLQPQEGVELIGGRTTATGLPAWLSIEPARLVTMHRWIRLRYSSSFFDDPVRPLIRFTTIAGKTFFQAMNGAVLGRAEWIGRVPDNTIAVSISPTRRLGPFNFRIDGIEGVSRAGLFFRSLPAEPLWVYWAVRSKLVKSRQEAWQALKYASTGTPIEDYHDWHARFARPLEDEDFDQPHAVGARLPTFRFLSALGDTGAASLQATVAALRAQTYPRWSLHACRFGAVPDAVLGAYREIMRIEPRLQELDDPAGASALGTDPPNEWVAVVTPGDTLPDYALAVVADAIARDPRLMFIYSDEDMIGADGRLHSPSLKPDWSPVFHNAAPYVGRLVCIRLADGGEVTCREPATLVQHERMMIDKALDRSKRDEVGHIRRILYRRRDEAPINTAVLAHPTCKATASDILPETWPSVTIVIPTRDYVSLLRECIRGLTKLTDYPSFDVVVVDNGSTEPGALALLCELREDPRFKVLDRRGPFNFSLLCNDGARSTNGAVLVFLNNDIAMLNGNWLKPLVRWAIRPEIGVVGAKLLFPNGRIQHAGVVLGFGGIAGHIYRRAAAKEAGYLNQLQSPHEVRAVTAACIAIERTKFEAVGGFDADHLPIDLNDIDLCLRIAERGWVNMWVPDSVLVHVQSASRGIERDPFAIYQNERQYFVQRWLEAIRDDPYFHPGLSLFAHKPSLA